MAHQMLNRRALSPTQHHVYALAVIACLCGGSLANAQGTPPPAKSQQAAGSMEMKKSMSGMMKNMENMPMSGDTDRDFAAMMRMHHQGALDMAQAELDGGKDPQLKAMAKKIISSQKKEIAEFDQWLGKHKTSSGPAMPAQK